MPASNNRAPCFGPRRRRCAWRVSLLLATSLAPAGCNTCPAEGALDAPPLADRLADDAACVRLYVTPLLISGTLASHPWFVVKRAGSHVATRWEVSFIAAEPFGFVRRDALPLESSFDGGAVCLISEQVGDAAAAIAEFIESQSPGYPCRDTYVLLPGPNSNSYAQWVLDSTGWPAELPFNAVGRDVAPSCAVP